MFPGDTFLISIHKNEGKISNVRLVYSVSFKKSERQLMIFALSNDSFSQYIKKLIKEDKERKEKIFTDEERKEIERIIEQKIREEKILNQTEY